MKGTIERVSTMTAEQKRALARKLLKTHDQKIADSNKGGEIPAGASATASGSGFPTPEYYRFDKFPEYLSLLEQRERAKEWGLTFNPFLKPHSDVSNDTITVDDTTLIGFSGYNYLGLSGHPDVNQAVVEAVNRYGTSPSASRLVGGEIDLHRALEQSLSELLQTDDCVVFVGGWSTNVSTIDQLLRPGDLVVIDELVHNSVIMGCQLSGARRLSFAHNDWESLDRILSANRSHHERVLVVIEGVYSMDGDIPNLPEFIRVKHAHKVLLMVDEAHSIGTLGNNGGGIREYFNVDARDVDVWMGTLSKSFASCGGYIAGTNALIEQIKYLASGFVYSVGLSPPNTASALAAIDVMRTEPDRVARVQRNAGLFLELARELNLNTGTSQDSPVVPILCGSSIASLRLSERLFNEGVDAKPVLHPAVPDNQARVRFFINASHTEGQIRDTVSKIGRLAADQNIRTES